MLCIVDSPEAESVVLYHGLSEMPKCSIARFFPLTWLV